MKSCFLQLHPAQRMRIGLGFILLLYVLISALSIHAPFFPLDDSGQIFFVRSKTHWLELLGKDVFSFFRPVKNILFWAFIHLADYSMSHARLLAILCGMFSITAVFSAVQRMTEPLEKALLITAIWALAPTLVACTAWLSAVNIMLMTGFAALTLCFHDRALRQATPVKCLPAALAACLCLALTLVAYEGGISVIPILIATDAYLKPGRFKTKRGRSLYTVYGLLASAYILLRLQLQSADALHGYFAGTSPRQAMLASAWFTLQHLYVWFWPFRNMAVIGSYTHGQVPMVVLSLSWVLLVSIAAFAWHFRRRYPELCLGIAWFLLGFAPMSNLAGFRNGPWGDYYMALAGAGLAWLLADLIYRLTSVRSKPLRHAAIVLAGGLLALRVLATGEAFRWSATWNHSKAVYAATLQTFPQAFAPPLLLAKLLIAEGDLENAHILALRSQDLAPQRDDSLSVLAVIADRRDDPEAALAYAEDVHRNNPENVWVLGFLGYLHEERFGAPETAFDFYTHAISKQPWIEDSLFPARRLAYLLATRNQSAAAIELWREVLRFVPDDIPVHQNLAVAYRADGRMEQSAFHRETAKRLAARNGFN